MPPALPRRAGLSLLLVALAHPVLAGERIRLEDIVAGGDGTGTAPSGNTGIDPATGAFTTGYVEGRISDTDGINPSPVAGSPYIDSVFFLQGKVPTAEDGCGGCFVQYITQGGVQLWLDDSLWSETGWNYILKDRVGGVTPPGIVVGNVESFTTAIGIHSSMGITFDLEALRERHGASAVGCFSTFWGMDSCATGQVGMMAMVADSSAITDLRSRTFTAGQGEFLDLELPPGSRYLTLLVAAQGPDACDHATFARPIITPAPCEPVNLQWIWGISPSRLSPQGEPVKITGEGISAAHRFSIGGVPLLAPTHAGPTLRLGTSPPLPPGIHDVEMLNSDGVVAWLRDAVEVVSPPVLSSATPAIALLRQPTPVTLRGANLRSDMVVFVEGPQLDAGTFQLLEQQFLTEAAVTGKLPGLPVGEAPGPRRIILLDQGRPRAFADLVTYIDAALDRVEPSTVSTQGGTRVTLFGRGLRSTPTFLLGGKPLTEVTLLDDNRAQGKSPPLAAGSQPASLADGAGAPFLSLGGAVTAVPPTGPALTDVSPPEVAEAGGSELVYSGVRLVPGLTPRLGGAALLAPAFIDSATYRGLAPPLPPGRHDAALTDAAGRTVAVLPGAVTVVPAQPPPLPGPVVIDADYAEGVARFNWSNPVRYDLIRIRDRAGGLFRELAGDATTFELPATRNGVELLIEGVLTSGDRSRLACAFAAPADCDVPPPLGGFASPGTFDFPLHGGNTLRNPARCAAGQGGGGGVLDLAREWSGINGFIQTDGALGYSLRARDRFRPEVLAERSYANRVVTGFTLPADSDRLQIEGYYQKLTEGPGLELKGRLVHIFPDDGFEDEFTFPDSPPGEQKLWHEVLYYRADREPGAVGARACNLPIPRGDYLLQIYAVNGDGGQVHYSFADDDRDHELLIPGAPCPPYPLVRVRDLTGHTTLPDIQRITARALGPRQVEFRAAGFWFDAEAIHSVDPGDPSYACHNFEFVWEIQGARPSTPQSTGASNVLVTEVLGIGCFWVNLTVRDRACGRSAFRRLQALAEPPTFSCNSPHYSVLEPVPDPRGIVAISGLSPPPGDGEMAQARRYSASVLVVPRDLCEGTGKAVPASAGDPERFGDEDLEFRLAWFAGFGLVEALPPSEIEVRDLCGSARASSLRYWQIDIDDLGRARPLPPPLDTFTKDGKLAPVLLQARTKTYRVRNAQGQVVALPVAPREEDWRTVGGPMAMTNRPESLTRSHWRGSFSERDQAYNFLTQATDGYQKRFDLQASRSIPVGIVPGIEIPSFENDFTSGLNSALRYVGGAWIEGKALVDNAGNVLGNALSASSLQIEGLKRELDAQTRYEWCRTQEIFSNVTEQTLFEAIVFSGLVGPVPITIWAKVGLALSVSITAQAGTVISPFAPLSGGHFVQSDLYLNSVLDFAIPAAIRADIAFGIVGVNYKLLPHIESSFNAHLGTRDLSLSSGLNLELAVKLDAQLQFCFFSFLEPLLGDLTCVPAPTVPIIPRQELISEHLGQPFSFEECPGGGGGGKTEEQLAALAVGGGGANGDVTLEVEYYFPAVASSPDGRTEIEVLYQKSNLDEKPRAVVRSRVAGVVQILLDERVRDLEPSIGFLSNRSALIAWTRSQPELAGVAPRSPEEYSLAELNLLRAQDEIVVTPLSADGNGAWSISPAGFIVSDTAGETPNPSSRRVDGRAAVAGDPTREQGLVAWVRIDDPELLKSEPGTTTYYRPEQPEGQTFVPDQAPSVRPHLERSTIHVRSVRSNGITGPARKISAQGINIEPSIAYSPGGERAYCVWVHDPVHRDLVGSNRGRNLVHAVYDPSSDTWSAPRPVISNPDAAYPGLLEPSIGLTGADSGVLAFTALEAGAPERDTGILASNRLVYISRLENGVFGPPVLIHGRCQKRVHGSSVQIRVPGLEQGPLERIFKRPDIYLFWQQGGPPGTPESSGGLMTSMLDSVRADPSPALAVGPQGFVKSNVLAAVSAAGIRTVAVNSGPALRSLGGAGGGAGGEPSYESLAVPLAPDLAVTSCLLSNQFPGPGAIVTARVAIENLGFAASAADRQGTSEVRLRAIYVDLHGGERVASETVLPVVPAGGTTDLAVSLEQPLEPVQLRMELSPNPGDSNAANDARTCAFGTPPPVSLACQPISLGEEEAAPAFQLTWSNPANYDEILLYRDGAQLASIPGSATAYVDRDAMPGPHTWEVRGRIDVSRSSRVLTTCGTHQGASFRRGDIDTNGREDITDPVTLLAFLFLGGPPPRCPDSADVDDSGVLSITDAIRILGYLFLGSAPPPAPGPLDCGADPTPDDLGDCLSECQ